MNRRSFLQRVCGGVVATLVVAKLPTQWLPEPVRVNAACEFLRKAFNEWRHDRIQAGASFSDAIPQRMTAGRELFEAYKGELIPNMRFMSVDAGYPFARTPSLMFKGVRLEPVGQGWRVECHG